MKTARRIIKNLTSLVYNYVEVILFTLKKKQYDLFLPWFKLDLSFLDYDLIFANVDANYDDVQDKSFVLFFN